MTLPNTMTFIEAAVPGGPEVLRPATGPVPAPGADEVLIRVLAAGVNRPDVQQRLGRYPPPPGASPVLGLEVAGEVVAAGVAVSQWHVGDRVCALTNGGGYAEYCVAPAVQALPWPRGYDALRAGALPKNYFTVWANVFIHGRLAAGEALLVHGGSSGIGLTALQLGKAFGATVYVTVGTAAKAAACLALGAEAAINYREADFLIEIQRQTRRGCRARHGGSALFRAQPALPGDGRAAGADRLSRRGNGGGVRSAADHDPAPDRHRLDHAPAQHGAEGGHRRGAAGQGVAAAGRGTVRAGDPSGVSTRRGGGGACADGKQRAYR